MREDPLERCSSPVPGKFPAKYAVRSNLYYNRDFAESFSIDARIVEKNSRRCLALREARARTWNSAIKARNPERPIKFVWPRVVCERALSACGYGSTLRTGVSGPTRDCVAPNIKNIREHRAYAPPALEINNAPCARNRRAA